MTDWGVLIPDLWGKSSDYKAIRYYKLYYVLIPDLWGKSSDGKKPTAA